MVSPNCLRRYPLFLMPGRSAAKAIALVAEDALFGQGQGLFSKRENRRIRSFCSWRAAWTCSTRPAAKWATAARRGNIITANPLAFLRSSSRTSSRRRPKRRRRAPPQGRLGARCAPLCEVDPRMGYALMRQAAMAAMERLHFARVELAPPLAPRTTLSARRARHAGRTRCVLAFSPHNGRKRQNLIVSLPAAPRGGRHFFSNCSHRRIMTLDRT